LAFRHLIDYNLAFTLLPPLYLGVYIGYYINLVSPNIVLFIMLVLIFLYLNYSAISKMVRVIKEKNAIQEEENQQLVEENTKLVPAPRRSVCEPIKIQDDEILSKIEYYFWWKFALTLFTIITFAVFSELTGLTGSTPVINLRSCTGWSYMIWILFIAIMLLMSFFVILFWRYEKEAIEKAVPLEEMDLTTFNLVVIIIVGFVAGIATSSLGLGVGTVTNPILLGFLEHYPPSVISATSVFIMMIVSTFSTVVFISTGQLNIEYSLILGIFVVIGTIIGLSTIRSYIKSRNDDSIIIYLLVVLVALSTVLLFTSGTIDVVHIIKNKPNEIFKFGAFCVSK